MRGRVVDGDLETDFSEAFFSSSACSFSLLRDLELRFRSLLREVLRFLSLSRDVLLRFRSLLRDVLLRFRSLLRDRFLRSSRLFLIPRSRLLERLLLFSRLTLLLRLPPVRPRSRLLDRRPPPFRLLSALLDRFFSASRSRLLERLFFVAFLSRLLDLSFFEFFFSRLGDLFIRSFTDLFRSFLASLLSEDDSLLDLALTFLFSLFGERDPLLFLAPFLGGLWESLRAFGGESPPPLTRFCSISPRLLVGRRREGEVLEASRRPRRDAGGDDDREEDRAMIKMCWERSDVILQAI